MKHRLFHIEHLSDETLLVIVNSTLRTEFYLGELLTIINKNYCNITNIVFDFILRNGIKDRFYQIEIYKNEFVVHTFKQLFTDEIIERRSNLFFSKNFDLINTSMLSRPQKFLLKKKLELLSQ